MEIALTPALPTYSGGLGILAGDMLRSAADMELPIVGVTLAYRNGYFRQHLDALGNQTESPDSWKPEALLPREAGTVSVSTEGRNVQLVAWRYDIVGMSGHTVPVYLLDSDVPSNTDQDRHLTDSLYGGDNRNRLCQEALLGIGGIGVLRHLGFTDIGTYHMNEGHSSLLSLALLEEELSARGLEAPDEASISAVRRRCVFTTHTPVPAGFDRFSTDQVQNVLGEQRTQLLLRLGCLYEGVLNMTSLALHFSRYINGVAMRHGEVSHQMFPHIPMHAITNGVHATTWTSPPFRDLYDRHVPEWIRDNDYLRYAVGIALDEIVQAHREAKAALIEEVRRRSSVSLDPAVFTIGFARRAATYKRADLLFSDAERLKAIVKNTGPLQIVYAGKAHPADQGGKDMIHRVFQAASRLKNDIKIVYLENYDMNLAKVLVAGVDLWLNTPHRPEEASGTSGMKAALNGVPSLSILDGWWIEGCFEGTTGWAIGEDGQIKTADTAAEAASLYQKLEEKILPLFYRQPQAYAEVMRSAITLNGSFFNTQRMLQQYYINEYFPEKLTQSSGEPTQAVA
jgi:starch phosphorylase